MKPFEQYIHNSRGEIIYIHPYPKTHWGDYQSDKFTLMDAVKSIAKQCRFNGHTPMHYSVARHSVLVSRLCGYLYGWADQTEDHRAYRIAALLHDIGEAIVGDIVSPIKHNYTTDELKVVEDSWAIRFAFESNIGAHLLFSSFVKDADRQMTAQEMKELLNVPESRIRETMGIHSTVHWGELMNPLSSYTWEDDVKLWNKEYQTLTGKEVK